MGGACKLCDLFCHICACTSYGASLHLMKWREGHLWCKRFCLSQANPPSNFFYWEVDEEEEIEKKKQKIKVFLLFEELQLFRLMPDYFKNQMLSPKAIKYYYCVNVKFPDSHVEEDPSVKSASRIKTSVSDFNRANDPMHIDFMCATSTGHVQTAYSSLLDNELILRKIHWLCSSSVEIKQKYLQLTIQIGQEIVNMCRAINRWCLVRKK